MNTNEEMVRQWTLIERTMKLANKNAAFRPQAESLVNAHFALIDQMVAKLERHSMIRA